MKLNDYFWAQEELHAMAEHDPEKRDIFVGAAEAATIIAEAVQGTDWDYPSPDALRILADRLEAAIREEHEQAS